MTRISAVCATLIRMRLETQAVHVGRKPDCATGAIAQPIYLSTTFLRDEDGEYRRGFSYGREDNPNRSALEQCLAAVEGGRRALAFSSGLAVLTALLQGLEPGDHVLVPDDVYYGLRHVVADVFGKWPLEVTHIDMTDLDAVRAAIRPATRLLWVETPSNPLLRITDLTAIADLGRKANAITVCDATFTTPVLQRPLDLGIDMVMHSTTKYFGGHSDVTGGALITRYDNYLFERVHKIQMYGGAAPSPFDCWLTLRGIDTLPYRVRAQADHALTLARRLETHPSVEMVHYPGLESHPQHALATRQMSGGFGAMLSVQVRGCAVSVAARTKLFTRATSLGGTHSLIEHRASVEGPKTKVPQNLLRVSVGLEHPDDLWADLDSALHS